MKSLLVWRACNLSAAIHSGNGPWSTRMLPVMRDLGSIPRGVHMWNWDSPVGVVSLHWWPRRNWSFWPRLRRALSRTVTRPSCLQCDNPTWPHTAFLSWFHTRFRPSFRLHNRHSQLLGESLQSHCIHTHFHWSNGPPICFPSWGTRIQSRGEYLDETRILLLALSCSTSYKQKVTSYIAEPLPRYIYCMRNEG